MILQVFVMSQILNFTPAAGLQVAQADKKQELSEKQVADLRNSVTWPTRSCARRHNRP